ncbi:Methionine gamma-lyase [Pirellula sp. SH-Sr6A]|uniref:trans-sulfuration enzyme family protein n=1 Tax=Pirellula sp. SH-Sr6A TaxID=1632865 RepID=UPI00078B628F|nr:aminotransferase class I/II-fold pyridoxal phosphate-dependent enzyme [Pirellula sp. SH-Sr6A]AMV32973.1 Methionine gamma-lyase [Pirellula sp. SH-Sr6A]
MKQPNPRPLSPPIQLSGVWEMDSIEQADGILGGTTEGFVYRRDGHPNATDLAHQLAALHRFEHGIVTAQGMSALAAACLSLLKPRDTVILAQPLYGKTSYLVKEELHRWGIKWIDIDATDLNAWDTALAQRPQLAIVETITNPRMSVPDLQAICDRAHGANPDPCIVLVDNTFATPALCQPSRFGADLVMESLSKFACGHGDAMLGFLGGNSEVWGRIRSTVSAYGLASSPLDCWLTQRGLATLDVRMERAAATAQILAERFANHASLRFLDYPGLPTDKSNHVARAQFGQRFGNMMTLHLHGGIDAANRFIARTQNAIPFCPSLGDTRTTLSHPASTSHRSYATDALQRLGIDGGTLRFSIGLEQPDALTLAIEKGLA